MLNLFRAGAVSKEVLRNISVAQGVQSTLPGELFHLDERPARRFDLFGESVGSVGEINTNMETAHHLISGKVFIVNSIEIKTAYHSPSGVVGVCSKCGAPWSPRVVCDYCGSERMNSVAAHGSIHGASYFEINSCRYHTAKIWGPLTAHIIAPALVIPTQTFFRLHVVLDREVNFILAILRGVEVRLMSA